MYIILTLYIHILCFIDGCKLFNKGVEFFRIDCKGITHQWGNR